MWKWCHYSLAEIVVHASSTDLWLWIQNSQFNAELSPLTPPHILPSSCMCRHSLLTLSCNCKRHCLRVKPVKPALSHRYRYVYIYTTVHAQCTVSSVCMSKFKSTWHYTIIAQGCIHDFGLGGGGQMNNVGGGAKNPSAQLGGPGACPPPFPEKCGCLDHYWRIFQISAL